MEYRQAGTGRAFVGRSDELEAVSQALAGARGGCGCLLLLCGEPGIGKSTLARMAARQAQSEDLSVHWGFAWEGGGAPAYWPWTQLFRTLLDEQDVPASLTLQLSKLLPEMASSQSAQDEVRLQPEEARFRLMEAVRSLLTLVSADRPIVLILEDLHDADSDSLQMLHYVARHINNLPIVLIGTFREIEARMSSASESLWRAARDARTMHLGSLDVDDVREYVTTETGRAPDDSQVRKLLATTEGNPLFLAELVALIGDAADEPTGGRVPDSINQVIQQQLQRLPNEVVTILASASVLGREFMLQELADLLSKEEDYLGELLAPAIEAEVIQPSGNSMHRFAHVLYRDVLHRGLARTERIKLHHLRADQLAKAIERGETGRWVELASQLTQAGSQRHIETVNAWRMAARQARKQLAFEDAVDSLANALDAFGAGPECDPADRCELLLELAEATMIKGDIEAGQKNCREAYSLASTLKDSSLMAKAALTYGSEFIVARVDPELVNFLQEALEHLPEKDIATRARVSGRLAAALQPATDPTGPVAMAREAIDLARTSDDDRVLFDTLRSAISAMMDFAPPEERAELNREYTALAERFGDVPEQFRGNLRLTIDASELGDPRAMSEAIDGCGRIAERLNLPHYQWRVASCRAMQAAIRGDFAIAENLINDAQQLGDAASDDSALLTLAIQRLGSLRDWDPENGVTLDEVQEQLANAYKEFPNTESFVQPVLAAYLYRSGDHAAGTSLCNDELIKEVFAINDHSGLTPLGEIAVMTDDKVLARKVYERLEHRRHHCSHLGLMGTVWGGPVSLTLARLAMILDGREAAHEYLLEALAIAERMHAKPMIARINAELAELLPELGEQQEARKRAEIAETLSKQLRLRGDKSQFPILTASDTTGDSFKMTLQGDVWKVEFQGSSSMIKQSKGMQMLARLIDQPNQEFHVLDLASSGSDQTPDAGDTATGLDEKARDAYRNRVADLQSELEEAEETGDIGRSDEIRGELDFITRELSRAYGLGGRQRQTGSAAERARVNVQRRIRDAIRRIGEQIPDAGQYLDSAIKTGSYCRYIAM